MSMTFTGTFVEKIRRSPGAVSFRFTRPPAYSFEAGQSFSITIPSPEGPLVHQFSHADSPTEPHTELTTRMTGSPFKTALDALVPGTEAVFRGPQGRFLFRYDLPKLAFLTGGVGITPVRSILRYLVDTGGAGRLQGQEIVLVYGCMTEDDIIYREEIDAAARSLAGLRVIYVVTQPNAGWKGYGGFITADILRAELGDASAWTYYVVGPPPMIVAMDKVTGVLQIPDSQIVKESFAGYTS